MTTEGRVAARIGKVAALRAELTYSEHMRWCKERALRYLDSGDTINAVTSMLSDLDKHPETSLTMREAFGLALAMDGLGKAQRGDSAAVRQWIEDFNE